MILISREWKSPYRGFALFCLLALTINGLLSCNKGNNCVEESKQVKIERISFQETVSLDKEIPIRLTISDEGTLCYQSIEANIQPIGMDSFEITAFVNYSQNSDNCPCPSAQQLDAVVFFNSSRSGKFMFFYNRDESNTTSSPGHFEIVIP